RFTITPITLLLTSLVTAHIPHAATDLDGITPITPSLIQSLKFLPTVPLFNATSLAPFDITSESTLRNLHDNPRHCPTHSTSPRIENISLLANAMTSMPNTLCAQTLDNWGPAQCKHHLGLGDADFYICGEKGKAIKCHSLAWATKHIVAHCTKNGRAEG